MASLDKRNLDRRNNELHPEKVVIVAGPSFGTAMEFILLGAVLGAVATLYWQSKRSPVTSSTSSDEDAILTGVTAGGAKSSTSAAQLVDRVNRLAKRARSLAVRTRDTLQSATEVIGPALSEAVAEGKTKARTTEQELQEEIKRVPEPTSVPGEQP